MRPPKRRKRSPSTHLDSSKSDMEAEGCFAVLGEFGGYIAFTLLLELAIPATLNHFFGLNYVAGTAVGFALLLALLGLFYVFASPNDR